MVVVGLTLVELLADVDVKVPGVIAIDVVPLVFQESVKNCPAVIELGVAVKDDIVGAEGGALSATVMTKSSLPDSAPSDAVSRRVYVPD